MSFDSVEKSSRFPWWQIIAALLALTSLIFATLFFQERSVAQSYKTLSKHSTNAWLNATVGPRQESPTLLYVIDGDSGSAKGQSLELAGLQSEARWFQDRPGRQSGSLAVEKFVSDWSKNGFDSVPPNAILQIGEGKNAETHAIELIDPIFVGDRLTFKIRADEGDVLPAGKFGPWSLFIDSVTTKLCFTLDLNAPEAGITYKLGVSGLGQVSFDRAVSWSALAMVARKVQVSTTADSNGSTISITPSIAVDASGSVCLNAPSSSAGVDWDQIGISLTNSGSASTSTFKGELKVSWTSPITGKGFSLSTSALTFRSFIGIPVVFLPRVTKEEALNYYLSECAGDSFCEEYWEAYIRLNWGS